MKLEILVPHYLETAEEIKPLLDSIALQQQVDLKHDVGVIICHDGLRKPDIGDIFNFELRSIWPEYQFTIKQIYQDHRGVSAARNACLNASSADYVMFCDADDMFFNMCGLWIIFREIELGFDTLTSIFVEETRDPKTKDPIYINRELDSTFVHGKIHRRKYLLENDIFFNNKLTVHEDSYFNILAQSLSSNVKYCSSPFYLWRWRDNSVCRHDPKYILKTYNNMLDSNDVLVDEFIKRNMLDKARFYSGVMIFDAYYTMNKPEWIDQENRSYRDNTEKRFSDYFKKHESLWSDISDSDKMMISNQVRTRTIMEGMQMESVTIGEWLSKIKQL